MPYTLMKALLWLVLALLIGFAIGWLLRSLVAHRQVARARSQRVDTAEVERMRTRVADFDSVVAERDRLAAELAMSTGTGGRPAEGPPDEPPAATTRSNGSDASAPAPAAAPPPPDATTGNTVASRDPTTRVAEPSDDPARPGPTCLDPAEASEVLGRRVEIDDLKAIEGIGPKIEELCHGIGIRTWLDLAETEVSLLRTMLTDAGARYKMHDPSTWPRQAELLAQGRWTEFAELTAELDRGKAARS